MKRLLIEKKDNYAKYVKEMHLPMKSRRKEEELNSLIGHLKHPVRETKKYKPGDTLNGIHRTSTSVRRTRANSQNSDEDYPEDQSSSRPHHQT